MPITALPTPPSRQDPVNFAVRADAFLGAINTFATEANALQTEVNTAAAQALVDIDEAGTAATNSIATAVTTAETAATTATTKATEAETAKTAAETAKTAAETAKTAAETAKTAAETAKTDAEKALDDFTDIFLGSKGGAPTLDNDGQAIKEGALYWNTVQQKLYIRALNSWNPAAFNVTGNVLSVNGRGGAVTINSTDVLQALAGNSLYTAANAPETFAYRDSLGSCAFNVLTVSDINSLSDKSLKTNVKSVDGISTLSGISPVEFTWKDTGKTSYGVIAQELEEVLPHLVSTNDSGTKSVNYVAMIGLLVDAVQKLDARVKELESK